MTFMKNPTVSFDYGVFTNKRLGPAASFASTIAENDSQEVLFSDYGLTLINEDVVMSTEQKDTRTAGVPACDSLSPTLTLLTTGQEGGDSTLQTGETKVLLANQLAISYAFTSWRILIDTKIMDTLRVFQKEHWIKIDFNAEKGDDTELKGIIVSMHTSLSRPRVLINFVQVEILPDAKEAPNLLH